MSLVVDEQYATHDEEVEEVRLCTKRKGPKHFCCAALCAWHMPQCDMMLTLPEVTQKLLLLGSHRELFQTQHDVSCVCHPKTVGGWAMLLPLIPGHLLHAPVSVSLHFHRSSSSVRTHLTCQEPAT